MGAYAPASGVVDAKMMARVEKEIIVPTLAAMEKEKSRYRGLLYVGLMMTEKGPKVIEYNCRFGDPETQAVLPLVHCDWYEAFRECASAKGNLSAVKWRVEDACCVSVVLASNGYPGKFAKGKAIAGIDAAEAKECVDVYFAGVSTDKKRETLMTSGGRVLAVTAIGHTLADAIAQAYGGVADISFDGMTYRKDIGAKGLRGAGKPTVKAEPVKKAVIKKDAKAAPAKKAPVKKDTKAGQVKNAPAKKGAKTVPAKKAAVKKAVKAAPAKKAVTKKGKVAAVKKPVKKSASKKK
jgi:hypothetical protein